MQSYKQKQTSSTLLSLSRANDAATHVFTARKNCQLSVEFCVAKSLAHSGVLIRLSLGWTLKQTLSRSWNSGATSRPPWNSSCRARNAWNSKRKADTSPLTRAAVMAGASRTTLAPFCASRWREEGNLREWWTQQTAAVARLQKKVTTMILRKLETFRQPPLADSRQ